MKFDKETFIGIGLCLILMLAWPTISRKLGWEAPLEEENSAPAEVTPAPAPAAPAAAAAAPAVVPSAKAAAEEIKNHADCTIGNGSLELTVAPGSGAVREIKFLNYLHNDREGNIAFAGNRLFALEIPGAILTGVSEPVIKDESLQLARTISINSSKLQITQIISLKEKYIINCRYIITNLSSGTVNIAGAVIHGGAIAPWHTLSGDKIRTMSHRLDILTADGDHEDIAGDEDDDDYYDVQGEELLWASVSNKYFCSVLKRSDGKTFQLHLPSPRATVTDSSDKEYNIISAGAKIPAMVIAPGSSCELDFASLNGPKDGELLTAFIPEGNEVMHLAWGPLNYLARFLMWILNLLYALCGSYGVSIIILTLLVRSAFYPITARGNESMRKMQKVQPLFKELKEKYKDDPQLLNQKMTELYRKEGINPLAGCLPILLQIPIFFALYAMLDNAVALRHVSFLWCKNLAAADTVFSIPLGFTLPLLNIDAIPVNPLVLMMTLLMVIQQRMTPMAADPAQKKMMAMMPVVMLLFLYDLPSGLTLYWTISNLFSIIQLWLQKRRNRDRQGSDAGKTK